MLHMKPVDFLQTGFNHLKLNYFPDVRFTDRAHHSKFHWPNNGVLRITGYCNQNYVLEDDLSDDDNGISTENKDDSKNYSTEDPPEIERENKTKEGRRHLPAGLTLKWSSNEIEILDFIISLTIQSEKDAYMRYKTVCTSRRIADRSFFAFKSKYHRLRKT
ncbi:unnamed protein product [Mytilus coruscus]|uniref:Uncharacterized protein n=1 Tax=Mytilus coruscus TaxID=42192 RepID=A0A6J8DNL0_MYTCO|nr:unnamed protein product [Mytilus coruscus]